MRLGALCDSDPAVLDQRKREHPGIPTFISAADLIASNAVDAIVLCVPHYDHSPIAIQALTREVPVLVEKPAAVHTRQVQDMIDTSEQHPDVPFGVMFNQRCNPLYQRVKEIVENGEIGAVVRSNWTITTWWRPQAYYDQSAWRATWAGEGGGVLVNQAPHQLDLWQWICGVPEKVFAKIGFGSHRDIAVDDEVVALVDYGQNRTGTFTTSTHDMQGTDRFEIVGESGKVVITNSNRAVVERYSRPEREISDSLTASDVRTMLQGGDVGENEYVNAEVIDESLPWGVQHCAVLENFAQNIVHGTPLVAPAAEGINAVRLANAIYLSAWADREVPFYFDEDEYQRELKARIDGEQQ